MFQSRDTDVDPTYTKVPVHTIDGRQTEGYYILKSRRFLWSKQLSLALTIVLGGVDLFSHIHQSTTFEIVSFAMYILSAMLILYFDGIGNLTRKKMRWLWSPLYLILFIEAAFSYIAQMSSWLAFGALVSTSILFSLQMVYAIMRPGEKKQVNEPTIEFTSGLLEYLSFSYINSTLIKPALQKISLNFHDDVPSLVDADSAAHIAVKFQLLNGRSSLNMEASDTPLITMLFRLVEREWWVQAMFQLISSISLCAVPLAVERILLHIGNDGSDDDDVRQKIPITIRMALLLIFLGPMVKSVGDGQNFVRYV